MENLIEILKNVPEGTKLYSTIHGDIYFDHIDATNIYPIKCYGDISRFHFTKDGKHYHNYDGECVLFPSKEQRDWSQFKVPCQFKLGDILTSNDGLYITIFNKKDCLPAGGKSNVLYYNYYYNTKFNRLEIGINYGIGRIDEYRYATETEKNILFDKLQEKGYFWNDETNYLEKYKFKVGDKVQNIKTKNEYKVIGINHDYYTLENKCYLKCSEQNKFETSKFDLNILKPYDKVLVRYSDSSIWEPQLFSCLDINLKNHTYKFVIIGFCSMPQCIPYEGNEHLIGTNNECDEYYKTWE